MPAFPAATAPVVSAGSQRPLPDVLEQVTPAVINITVTSHSLSWMLALHRMEAHIFDAGHLLLETHSAPARRSGKA
ncbi:hypothetical protein NKH57_27520 [Mesorhizobium sp. M1050]|uniref:hypothetical protein n=1 Tax=Mesorhizobium sp. M1050 TaxID=2957051 RepID=UPI003338E69F